MFYLQLSSQPRWEVGARGRQGFGGAEEIEPSLTELHVLLVEDGHIFSTRLHLVGTGDIFRNF